jgi:hypothetical protein
MKNENLLDLKEKEKKFHYVGRNRQKPVQLDQFPYR